MTRADITRRGFLAGTSSAALAATTPLYAAEQEEPKGGIGGTGIVGTLTDFGSLMVNGQRILLTPETTFAGPLGPLAEADLAIGQALTIEADAASLTAARVFVADPVIGRVKTVDNANRTFVVDGQVITLDPSLSEPPQQGDRVAVSGLWRDDQIVATRHAPAPDGPSALSGVYLTEAGALPRIGKERLFFDSDLTPPPDGAFVVVRGSHQAGAFFVEELEIGRFFGAAGPLRTLSVEGYLRPTENAPFYEIAGLGHSFDKEAQLAPLEGARAIFEGAYTGAFEVAEATVLSPDFNQRRAQLHRGDATPVSTR